MHKQKDLHSERHGFSAEEEKDRGEHLSLGEEILKRYFEWAPTIDRFEPIRVEPELDVNIPDLLHPGQDLVALGRTPTVPIRYRGRIDLLVVDGYNAYWVVEHRVVEKSWDNIDLLLLDERGIAACWAFQQDFIGMKISGVIYNELHKEATPPSYKQTEEAHLGLSQDKKQEEPAAKHRRMYMQAEHEPIKLIKQQGNKQFAALKLPEVRPSLRILAGK